MLPTQGLLKPSLNRLSARGPDGAITGHEVAKHDVFELDIKKHVWLGP
jgi:hypothetical protein